MGKSYIINNMKSLTKIFTLILILVAVVFLVYGYLFNHHKVISTPASETQVTDNVSIMTEPQLLDEMCYDGIARDKEGNLIKKQREKACPT